MRRYISVSAAVLPLLIGSVSAEAITIDVTSGTSGQYFPSQSFNETRGVDVTVLTGTDLAVSSMTLNALNVGGDGTATVGARIYSSPSGALLASRDTTVFASGSVTLHISATMAAGQSYRVCFFCGPLGPGEDNSATLFEPAGFPYTDGTGSLRINQAYESPSDSYPTNQNIFDPWILIQATPAQSGVAIGIPAPGACELDPAAPNPFTDRTTLRFELARAVPVEVSVVSSDGRAVRTLMRPAPEAAGVHSLVWDGRDDHGQSVAAGVYFVRLRAETQTRIVRVQLLR